MTYLMTLTKFYLWAHHQKSFQPTNFKLHTQMEEKNRKIPIDFGLEWKGQSYTDKLDLLLYT